MKLIFVGGVHGVGKTTVCTKAAEQVGGLHLTASGLIRAERASVISEQTKEVADVRGNQQLLIDGYRRRMQEEDWRIGLLDGHFTLRVAGAGIEPIPTDVFGALAPAGLVCLFDDPESIASRIVARDGVGFTAGEIARAQSLELMRARAVSDHLRVPLTELRAFDVDGLIRLIAD